jgi:predicted nucleic acid-binding protein
LSRPIVIDASVALKWVIDEEHHLAARRLVVLASRFTAPEIMLAEVANVLRKKVRRGELGQLQASVAIDGIRKVIPTIEPAVRSAGRVLELAIALDHHAYDCVYLALAERLGGVLVTADRVLVDKRRHAGLAIDVWPLDEPGLLTRLTADA